MLCKFIFCGTDIAIHVGKHFDVICSLAIDRLVRAERRLAMSWNNALPERVFKRDFNVRLNKDTKIVHKITVSFKSSGDTPKDIAEALLGKRVIAIQNSLRAGASDENKFKKKCLEVNGSTYPLVPAGGGRTRPPTTEEALEVLAKAIDDGTLTKDNVSPTLAKKLAEQGIVLK